MMISCAAVAAAAAEEEEEKKEEVGIYYIYNRGLIPGNFKSLL